MEAQLQRALDVLNEKLAAWPLHKGKAGANFLKGSDTDLWLGYRTDEYPSQRHRTTNFDVNIINGTFYILWVNIPLAERGKGHGNQLYEILTQVAQDLGCHRIVQFPSGWAVIDGVQGETRRSYLERRGWLPWNKDEVHKELVDPAMASIDEGIFKDVSTALRANEGNG